MTHPAELETDAMNTTHPVVTIADVIMFCSVLCLAGVSLFIVWLLIWRGIPLIKDATRLRENRVIAWALVIAIALTGIGCVGAGVWILLQLL